MDNVYHSGCEIFGTKDLNSLDPVLHWTGHHTSILHVIDQGLINTPNNKPLAWSMCICSEHMYMYPTCTCIFKCMISFIHMDFAMAETPDPTAFKPVYKIQVVHTDRWALWGYHTSSIDTYMHTIIKHAASTCGTFVVVDSPRIAAKLPVHCLCSVESPYLCSLHHLPFWISFASHPLHTLIVRF